LADSRTGRNVKIDVCAQLEYDTSNTHTPKAGTPHFIVTQGSGNRKVYTGKVLYSPHTHTPNAISVSINQLFEIMSQCVF